MPELESIFDEIRKARGGVAAIHHSFSQFPHGVEAHFKFYSSLMLHEPLPLPREEREWLAVHTSRSNECPYCIEHHQAALKKHIGRETDISDKRHSALADLAVTLTKEPWRTSPLHSRFMEVGFTESQWQHAVMIVGYFNFANRCAHAMGLKTESDFTSTCN